MVVSSKKTVTFLSEKEMSLVSDLIKEMGIRFCIFWTDATEVNQIKRKSIENVASTQLNTPQFGAYFTSNYLQHPRVFSTVIVYKGTDLSFLEEMTQIIHRVN